MDGFGIRKEKKLNAVAAAEKPSFDRLLRENPHVTINGSGLGVGLPEGQMGNSEVGHLNIGAGRIVYQDITRIDKSITDGDFFSNPALVENMKYAVDNDRAVHLFGLISDGCVHSSLNHLRALVKMAAETGVKKLYLHAFMDGRDTSPTSGAGYMKQVLGYFDEFGLGRVATVMGRYYGMDRDKRWERTEKAYRAIVNRTGVAAIDPVGAIEKSYENEITDEFIVPVVIDQNSPDEGALRNDDVALFFNFRADRVRQLSYILDGWDIENYPFADRPRVHLVTMTSYDKRLKSARVAFPPTKMKNIFGEVISRSGLRQLRLAETEKYAHVTYFFNGGTEEPFEGEERLMVSSPKVATYDLKPEMSSVEVTDRAVESILSGNYDVIIMNYANCDMVGHTGIFEAAVKAVEAVDTGLGRVLEAVEKVRGQALVTSDHGNAEQMFDPATDGPHTAHTTNPVPLVFFDAAENKHNRQLRTGGVLADIAPTILHYLGIEQPGDMTGQSLFVSGEIPA